MSGKLIKKPRGRPPNPKPTHGVLEPKRIALPETEESITPQWYELAANKLSQRIVEQVRGDSVLICFMLVFIFFSFNKLHPLAISILQSRIILADQQSVLMKQMEHSLKKLREQAAADVKEIASLKNQLERANTKN
jgi:hypothetical protein